VRGGGASTHTVSPSSTVLRQMAHLLPQPTSFLYVAVGSATMATVSIQPLGCDTVVIGSMPVRWRFPATDVADVVVQEEGEPEHGDEHFDGSGDESYVVPQPG
jgi:hypothetical protein